MRIFKYHIDGREFSVRVDEKEGTIADFLVDGHHPKLSEKEMPIYAAVISLALIEHEVEIVHDEEPGVITLSSGNSGWGNPSNMFTQA